MTAREIYKSCIEDKTFILCLNIEIEKQRNLAKVYPKGEIHYFRQAMWEIQQKLQNHTFFNGWASCGYGFIFGENGANSNLFDWVDGWMKEEYNETKNLELNNNATKRLYASTERRYFQMFSSFLLDYRCFHKLDEQLNNAISKSEWSKCLRSDSKIIKAYLAIEDELSEQGYIKDGCWAKEISTLQELIGTLRDNYYFKKDIRGGKPLHSFIQARFRVEEKFFNRFEERRINNIMANIKRKRRLQNINIKPQ